MKKFFSRLTENMSPQARNSFWSIIILLAASSLNTISTFRQASSAGIWQAWTEFGMVVLFFVTLLISAFLNRRGHIQQALRLFIVSFLLTIIARNALTEGLGILYGLIVIAITSVLAYFNLPGKSANRLTIASIVIGGLIVLFDLVVPPYRQPTPLVLLKSLPFVGAMVVLILLFLSVRQAWTRNNIRSRFLLISMGLTLTATVVIAVISVNSFLSAGQQQQEITNEILRNQIRETLGHQTVEVATKNDAILQGISRDAQDVAQQAANIFENPNAFYSEAFWKADDHMFFGPEGQYINGESDVSTGFVPNTVEVNDDLKHQLELLAFLDMALVPVYEDNPNVVAIYFVDRNEISWLHPNINLGSIVPPDYLATQDIFYTTGSPENNPDRQAVWTPVYDDPGGQGTLVSVIAPVYARNRFMGVIGIDVSLAGLTETIETEDFGVGEGVYALLLDTEGKALALPEQAYLDILGRERQSGEFGVDIVASARPEFTTLIDTILAGETGLQSVVIDDQELFVAYAPLSITGWHIASIASTKQVLAPVAALETTLQELTNSLVYQRIVPVSIALIVLVVFAGIFFTNRLAKPIEQLTEGASRIGVGEWDTPLPKSELVEIDGLSNTLGIMARQLKGTLDTLEQRVADRTRNLELAAEVGRTVSQVRDLDVMLKDACELILKEFDLYYVQVYLTDPSGSNLKLEAGTGSVGEQLLGRSHSLPLNSGSINGRAAVEKRSVVIADTAQSPTFRPNQLLPDTRGEMAVPLIVADRVVGVLDMQANQPGMLTEEVLPAFEALAGQLAVAIQNANLLEETNQARAQVEAQARRLVREGWQEHLDAIHKPEQLGFVFAQNKVAPLAETEEAQIPDEGKSISVPIAVTGEPLGSLVVEIEDETRREQTSELVNVVARQVAQQIENLRLLESAERFRHEAERAARLQTLEGWQKFVEARNAENLGYIYDTREVRPQAGGQEEDVSMFAMPLKARDEMIGKVSVQGLTHDDQESVELVNAVAERLSAHIENLRLFEETRMGQLELDKRARQLAAVAEISNVSSKELDVQKMLESVVHLAQRQFGLYHAHVFIYDEKTDALKITACGWKEGDENEGAHETAAIPLDKEQSLVARAARTKQAVIANNVFLEPGWLPNPLLPDTASELAVPLVIGDKVLGVLDVQSDRVNAFTEEDANIQTTLASQVVIALQNARSFTQAQKQAERESMLNVINQKIQSATSVEAVLQIAARELGHALGAPMTVAQLSMKDKTS